MMEERIWTDRPLPEGAALQIGTARVTRRPAPGRAYLLGGDVEAGLTALWPGTAMVGLLETAPEGPATAIRLGRHSALVLTDTALDAAPGWHAPGFSLSEAHDAFAGFDIDAPDTDQSGADYVLAQGGVADTHATAPAATVLFAGITCALIRKRGRFVLWVPAAHVTYISSFFAGMDGTVGEQGT